MTKSKDEAEWESSSLTSESQSGEEAEKVSPEILSETPENKRPAVVTVSGEVFSGPVPPPKMLKEYESIEPGAAGQMITMAEKEQDIRDRTNTGLRENDRLRIWGAMITSLCLIVATVICAYIGQVVIAIVLGSSGAISIIKQQWK